MAYTYGTTTYAKDSNGNVIKYNNIGIYEVRLGYQLNSQREENGKGYSNISLQLEVRSVNSSYQTYGYNQTTTIDGTSLSAKTFDFRQTNVWQVFGTRTFDVEHDSDGNYTATKSGSFTTTASGSSRPKTGNADVSFTLPNIPLTSVRIRVSGAWKRGTPYVRVNGAWKKGVAYTRVSGNWKKGS